MHRLARGFVVAPALLGLFATQATDPPGALPYDLAFDQRDFLWSTEISVTPDGRKVVYDVHQPIDSNLSERYQPNGTPSSSVGAKVYYTDGSGDAVSACPSGNCWRGTWSPDGKSIAYYSDAGGPPTLWVYELTAKRARKVSDAVIKAKLWSGDEPRWSPDGATVYVPLAPEGEFRSSARPADPLKRSTGVSVLRSGTEVEKSASDSAVATPLRAHFMRENLATLAAIDVRTGKSRILVPGTASPAPSVLRLSASGKWVSYLSVFKESGPTSQASSMDLAVVPVAGGPVRLVVADLPQLDDYHRLDYSWHPTDDRLVYLKDKHLWLVEVGPNGPTEPKQLGASLGDLAPALNWFTSDGKGVVVGIDPFDDHDYRDPRPRGIAIVPLDGGAPIKLAIDDAKWKYRDILKADERTVWQPEPSTVTVLLHERATGNKGIVRLNPITGETKVLWTGLARLHDLTSGGNHQSIVGTYQDLKTPNDVYRFSADFSRKERVSHLDPRLDQVRTGTVEIFETAAPLYDGRLATVKTAVILPAGAKRGDKLPAIVLMYPGSDISEEAERYGGAGATTVPNLVFTSRGYAIVLANLTLGPNAQPGNPMQEMVDILLPQVYHAAELGYIDIQRVALAGQSFGGYGTASIISRTNLFRCAIAVSGIYDLPGTYGHMDESGGTFWIGWNEGGQARMGSHPWANFKRYIDNSPYYQADKIFTPLLLVHGTSDMAYHDAQKLFNALRRLDRPAQLASYAGQGHVISEWTRPSAVDAAGRMVDFLRKHLGDPAKGSHASEGAARSP